MRETRTNSAALLLLGLLLLLPACRTVTTSGSWSGGLGEGQTFSWSPGSTGGDALSASRGLPVADFRRAVAAEFTKRGLREVDPTRADVFVDVELDIELQTRFNDPYDALYVAERYEEGIFTLELRSRTSIDEAWSGETRERLRFTARSLGGLTTLEWHPVEQERTWDHADAAKRLVSSIPR